MYLDPVHPIHDKSWVDLPRQGAGVYSSGKRQGMDITLYIAGPHKEALSALYRTTRLLKVHFKKGVIPYENQ